MWVRGWRVWITWECGAVSPTGEVRQRIDVTTPAALRAVTTAALADPWVATYRVLSTRAWDPAGDPAACPAGHELVPAGVGEVACRCGGHRQFRCHLDGWSTTVPGRSDECGAPAVGG